MSLFGAMNTAISGMTAQSNAFGNISDNVANSQTVGYKRVDTSFIDFLTESTAATNVPGAVVTRPDYVNNVEGTITQTDNTTGMAITGQGFFAVSKLAGQTNSGPTFDAQTEYTRAGDFQMDKNGYLVNSSGLYLNGWKVTQDPTTGANVVNQNTLAPIQVSQTVFNPIATTNVNLSANLPATPTMSSPYSWDSTNPDDSNPSAMALAALAAAGRAVAGNAPSSNANVPAAQYLTDAQAAVTATSAQNIAQAMQSGDYTAINAALTTVFNDSKDFSTTYAPSQPISSQVNVYDALGNAQTVTLNWSQQPIDPTTSQATPSTWMLQIQGGSPLTDCGTAKVTFDPTTGMISGISSNDGISAPSTSTAGTPAKLAFTASFNGTKQNISLSLGTFGKADGLTQFAGADYNLRGLTQNGVPPGAFSSVSTAANGDISVNYDNGQSRVVARVPIVTFNDPDALQRQDGQAFTVSKDSGGPLAETASTNGAGGLLTQEIEGSNVDIATEFSKLIVAQQAYSANTKMITTASQMLQQTIDMKQ